MGTTNFLNSIIIPIVIFVIAFQLLIGGGALRYFIWYLRTVQIIAHLPMQKTIVPANVNHFFRLMIPLLTFDLLDSDWTTKYVFNFDFAWHEKVVNEKV